MRPMTDAERALAESVLEIVPVVINSMGRSFPGIRKKLTRIDARSVAYVAICRATQTYNPAKSKPGTYFSTAVRNALLKELARSRRLRYDSPLRVPCALAEKVDAALGYSGGVTCIQPYASAPVDSKGRTWLWQRRGITQAQVAGLLATLPQAQREQAEIDLQNALSFRRNHPLVETFGAALGMTAAEIDDAFREASRLA